MTKQRINIGQSANDKAGDPLRTAFSKINDNFDELYNSVSAVVVVSATAPAAPGAGDLWWNSESGRMYVYYGSAWVDASPVDGAGINSTNELVNGAYTVSLGTDGVLTFPGVAGHRTTFGSAGAIGDVLASVDDLVLKSKKSVTISSGEDIGALETNYTNSLGPLSNALTAGNWGGVGYPASYTSYAALSAAKPSNPLILDSWLVLANEVLIAYNAWQAALNTSAVAIGVGDHGWGFDADGDLTLPTGGDILDSTGTSVLGGGGASIGNWTFRNDTMYNYAGGQINNSDTTHDATSGLVLPDNENIGAVTNLFNNYGNVVLTSGEIVASDLYIGGNGSEFYTDVNINGTIIDGWHQRNPQQIEINIFTAPAPIWSILIGASLGATVIVTYSTPSGDQTFTSVLSQQFTGQGQYDPNHSGAQRYSGRIDGTLPVGQTGIVTINFPTSSTTNSNWVFDQNGVLTVPGPITKNNYLSLVSTGSGNSSSVDADGQHGRLFLRTNDSTTTNTWTFDINGNLTLPAGGTISNTVDGIKLETNRGTLAIGTNMETPGVAQHFHIAFENSNSAIPHNDLFLGDDYNYVKLPGDGLNITNPYGVEIGTHYRGGPQNVAVTEVDERVPPGGVWRLFISDSEYPNLGATVSVGDPVDIAWGSQISATITEINQLDGDWQIQVDQDITAGFDAGPKTVSFGSQGNSYVWRFETDGKLALPTNGTISYAPDDTDNWEDPTINTVQAALDELAARVTALQNFEIDGGNAYTPAVGELLIDGNGA